MDYFSEAQLFVDVRRIPEARIMLTLLRYAVVTTRQVELFCIDRLVMVTVEANDEFLYLDLAFPTTKLHGRGMGEDADEDMAGCLNGMEAAFQVSNTADPALSRGLRPSVSWTGCMPSECLQVRFNRASPLNTYLCLV